MKTPSKPEFWVTNASPMNVTLADLALNIKAHSTVNLLDKKHYNYTLEQLIKSKEAGSIFKKRDKIYWRSNAPSVVNKDKMPMREDTLIPSRGRSILSIKEIEYDELRVSDDKDIQKKLDEEYARENADLVEADTPKINARLEKKE